MKDRKLTIKLPVDDFNKLISMSSHYNTNPNLIIKSLLKEFTEYYDSNIIEEPQKESKSLWQ